ncbi:MAG TPA: hypothetical protein VF149_01670 [Bacillales bacterium]
MGIWPKSATLRAIGIPCLTLVIFGGLLLYHNLQQEQILPAKGWSQSITLPAVMPLKKYPFVQKNNDTYEIFTYAKDGIDRIVLDQDLNVVGQSMIPVDVPADQPFWVVGNKVFFVRDHQLVGSDGKSKKVLAEKVDGLAAAGNTMIIWKDKTLYKVDPKTLDISSVGEMKQDIKDVAPERGSSSFLVITNVSKNQLRISFFRERQAGDYERSSVLTRQVPSKSTVAGFNFATDQNKMKIAYTETGPTSGGMYTKNFLTSINLDHLQAEPSTKLLKQDRKNRNTIFEPEYVRVFFVNHRPILLSSATGHLFGGEEALSIFRSVKQKGKWVATQISSTEAPSTNPFLLEEGTVLWLDFQPHGDQHKRYVLMAASQNPDVIAASRNLTDRDWGNAVSDSLVSAVVGLMMFFYACLWGVPAGIFLFAMFITNTTLMERNPPWVKYTAAGLFMVTQLFVIQTLFNASFYKFAPDYLTFTGSSYAIPLVLVGLSWFLMRWVKGKEWGNIAQVIYFIGIDVWMLIFLIGAYTI